MPYDQFNHQKIEAKWQKYWQENKTFKAEKGVKPKFYALDMFPYPSGAGLHVGHPEGYTASDILARKRRMEGYEVLHPMGWDAFGLPAENYAIKTGTHPRVTTEKNIETFTAQIKALGFSYDWDREINTTDPEYFKWTQWIFLKLFNSYFDQEENRAKPIGELEKSFAIGTKNADFNKKRGVAPRRGVAHSGNKARPSLVLTMLAEKIYNVNAKKNPKTSLRDFYKKIKINGKTIIFDGLALANHFKKTKNAKEYKYRNKWRTTVVKAMDKLFFESDEIAYFKVKTNIFRVVLKKTKDQNFIIKTYYRVKSFSDIFSIYKANADYWNNLTEKEQNELLSNYRLAYEKEAPINFCPSCKTGLANEEVVDGKCERCGEEVTRKNLRQWILRITEYAERLIADLSELDDWPTKIKLMQENWIGRSEGAEVDFELVEEFDYKIPSEEEFAKVKAICEKEDLSSYQLRKGDFLIALKDGEMEGFGRILKINDLREISSVWLSEKYRGCKLGQKIVLKLIEKSAGKEFYLNCYQKIKNYYAEVDFEEIAEPKEEQLEKIKYYYEKKRKEKFDLAKVKEEMAFMVHRKCTDFRYSKYPCTHSAKIRVFTTRPDTLFGATYFVLAPEHPLVNKITTGKQKVAVEKYIEEAAKKSDLQRTDLAKEKSGVFTGGYVINPVNGEKIPVWIADYVLMSYGTGAIMAVPAHDERDAEFAKQFDLPIKEVVKNPKNEETECFSGEGIAINSEFLNGLKTKEAKQKMIEYLEEEGLGKRQINYKLRDWIFSRQRYWGEPIPVVHCENCGTVNGVADFARYEYETDNKKGRDTRRGPIVPAGGSTQVCQVNLPLVPRIIASIAYDCKNKFKKTRNRNNRKAVRDIFNKVRNIKKIDSKSLGEINVNWTFLWRHFQKKSFMEFQIRAKLALVVMEVLKKDDFCVESKQEKNCFIFYGRAENNIFTIIVGKRNGEYYLKTFYQSTKLTKTWKDLKSNIGTLPLTLPEVEKFEPSGTGESPLANIDEWVKTTCPKCNEPAKRETNTMPQWAGSSWYWLRFMDPHNLNEFCSKENEKYWGPVDLYVGGAEHAVLHLLYSRFWHKVLYDLGYVSTIEPFKSLKNQGMILAEDGEKMSKSKGNVINPDDIVKEFGADTLRVYEMFMGPFEQAKAWNTNAVEGIYKFLQRVWRLFEKQFDTIREDGTCKTGMQDDVRRLTHKTVKKVSEDIEAFKFNTAISAMMVFVNEAGKWEKLPQKTMEKFIKILAPFAPHLAEEIWHDKLGNKATIAYAAWPEWNEDLAKDEEINLAIQVNGKLRATISVSADVAKEEALKMAKESENVQKWLEGKTLVKEIFVPGKIVNLVVK